MRVFFLLVAVLAVAPSTALADSSFLHSPPAEAVAGVALKIEGSLLSGSFTKLVVRYRAGAIWDESELELQYGDLYRGIIPAGQVTAPQVSYYIEAVTSSGDRVQLLGSQGKPMKVKVLGDAPAVVEASPPADRDPPARIEKAEQNEAVTSSPALSAKCRKLKQQRKRLPKECEEPKRETDPDATEPKHVEATEPSSKPEPRPEPRVEARSEPRPEPKKEPEPRPTEPEPTVRERDDRPPPTATAKEPTKRVKKQSELEEELALYGAEASGGLVQHVDDDARTSAQSPTILLAADLKRLGVRSVYEALDLVPGLAVSRDMQGFYRVAVRGLRSDAEVLFQLNGHRLNNFYDGKALSNVPVDTLERIEVFRGPALAEVGLGNVLAVINLVTNRDEGLRLSGSAGLYSSYDGHLSAAKTFGGLKLFVDGDFATQAGTSRPVVADGLNSPSPKFTTDRRLLVNAGLGATYENEGLGQLALSGRFMLENRSALLGLFDVVGGDSNLSWQAIQANLGWSKRLSPSAQVGVTLWFDQQDTARLWQLTPDGFQIRASDPATLYPDGVLEKVSVGARGFGLLARAQFELPAKNRLVATLNGDFQSLSSYDYLSNLTVGTNVYAGGLKRPDGLIYPTENGPSPTTRGPAADRLGLGISVMDTWTLLEAVAVQVGVRFDLTQLPRADASGTNTWAGATLTPSVGPRAGLVVTPIPSLSLRGQYGRSYRAPTVQELAETIPNIDANQGRTIGNPKLEGAYLDSVEAGFDYVQAIGDGKLKLRGQGFFEHMGNAIASVDNSGNLVPMTNRPLGVQALGVEGEARFEVTSRATAWLNASWVRAEDLATPATARLLTDVPQLRFNAGFSLPIGPYLAFDVIARYASERRNNSRTVLELIRRYTLPAYATFAAQLRTELLFDHLELAVLGQNVFNLEYADDAFRPDRVSGGVPRETVTVFGTVRVVF